MLGFCGGSILTISPSGSLSGAKGYSWTAGVVGLPFLSLKGSFRFLSVVVLSSLIVLLLLLPPPRLCKILERTMVAVVAAFVLGRVSKRYYAVGCRMCVALNVCFEFLSLRVFESNSLVSSLIYERRKAVG